MTYDQIQVPTDVLQNLIHMADELSAFRDLSSYREAQLKKAETLLDAYLKGDAKRAEQVAQQAAAEVEAKRKLTEQPVNWGSW